MTQPIRPFVYSHIGSQPLRTESGVVKDFFAVKAIVLNALHSTQPLSARKFMITPHADEALRWKIGIESDGAEPCVSTRSTSALTFTFHPEELPDHVRDARPGTIFDITTCTRPEEIPPIIFHLVPPRSVVFLWYPHEI